MREVRALLKAGKLDEAWRLFESLPAAPENLLEGSQVARARFRQTVDSGDFVWLHRAHTLIEIAVSALRGRPEMLHVEVHYTRAIVELEIGDNPHAFASLQWLQTHGPSAAGATWPLIAADTAYMLALVYEARREHVLAWHHYSEALRLAEREGRHEIRLKALHNLTWLALGDGNADKAEELLTVSEVLSTTQHYRWHHRLRVAYCLYVRGDHAEAAALLQQLYSEVRSGVVNRAGAELLAWICWLSGRIALALELTAEAEGFCDDGQAWSCLGSDLCVMTELSRLRAAIADRQGLASD